MKGGIRGGYVVVKDVTAELSPGGPSGDVQPPESLGRCVGEVAHDLNNLLTVMSSHSDFLQANGTDSQEARRSVEEIQKAVQMAASLTRQLLSSIRAPRPAQAVDLNRVLSELLPLLHRLVGDDVAFHLVPGLQIGDVVADPDQLQQIVIDLVLNARDAMPNGGRVTLSTEHVTLGADAAPPEVSPGEYVRLSVVDTGCGKSEVTRAHLFEASPPRTKPGAFRSAASPSSTTS